MACLSNVKAGSSSRFQKEKVKRVEKGSISRNAPALGGDLAGCHLQISPNDKYLVYEPQKVPEGPAINVSPGCRLYASRIDWHDAQVYRAAGIPPSRWRGRHRPQNLRRRWGCSDLDLPCWWVARVTSVSRGGMPRTRTRRRLRRQILPPRARLCPVFMV